MAKQNKPVDSRNEQTGTSNPTHKWLFVATVFLGIALTAGYVYVLPKLIAFGVEDQGYYILLIPWALCCVVLLIGILRAYAYISHQQLGTKIELRGSAALFAVIVIGGFLLPSNKRAFALTVRAHSTDQSKITTGQVTLECADFRRAELFGNNGEANFKGVPRNCMGSDQTRLLPEVSGYCQEWQELKITGIALELTLKTCAPHLRGIVMPVPRRPSDVRIIIDDGKEELGVNTDGRFDVPVTTATGSVHLQVFVGARNIYDSYQTVPGSIAIPYKTR